MLTEKFGETKQRKKPIRQGIFTVFLQFGEERIGMRFLWEGRAACKRRAGGDQESKVRATRWSKERMRRCCGQIFSHAPQPMQAVA
jgi:hypothetical protein